MVRLRVDPLVACKVVAVAAETVAEAVVVAAMVRVAAVVVAVTAEAVVAQTVELLAAVARAVLVLVLVLEPWEVAVVEGVAEVGRAPEPWVRVLVTGQPECLMVVEGVEGVAVDHHHQWNAHLATRDVRHHGVMASAP
jgi:hypothetical protein